MDGLWKWIKLNVLVLELKMVKKDAVVVKIDSDLLEEVEDFINLEENKFRYANKKQFIDIAVSDYLRRVKK